MDHFAYRDGVLYAEDVPMSAIAEAVGTPVYVYSRATLERHARVFREALSGLPRTHIAFAIKANPNLAVLKVLAREGYGADIVSGGEMKRALAAGMPADHIVFSGVGKTLVELREALEAGVGQFNIELEEEGIALAGLAAAMGKTVTAVLRVNPDVDAGTHAKISTGMKENKFGVPIDEAGAIFARLAALPGLAMRGLALHIGSQIFDLTPIEAAYAKVGALAADLRGAGHDIDRIDLGGGLGVPYERDKIPPTPADYGAMVRARDQGLGFDADVRAGARHRRQCRRPADARHLGEAWGDPALCDRGRGDERPCTARHVRCVPRFRGRGADGRADGRQYRGTGLRERRYLCDGTRH